MSIYRDLWYIKNNIYHIQKIHILNKYVFFCMFHNSISYILSYYKRYMGLCSIRIIAYFGYILFISIIIILYILIVIKGEFKMKTVDCRIEIRQYDKDGIDVRIHTADIENIYNIVIIPGVETRVFIEDLTSGEMKKDSWNLPAEEFSKIVDQGISYFTEYIKGVASSINATIEFK